jgi:hypothetical protein
MATLDSKSPLEMFYRWERETPDQAYICASPPGRSGWSAPGAMWQTRYAVSQAIFAVRNIPPVAAWHLVI